MPIDAGDRQHLRPVPALDPAAGPGQDPGGRDPRPGDGRDRRAGVADRAHGLQHPAHQRRAEHGHAPARHGRAAVPDHRHAGGRPGPAAGAADLQATAASRPCPAPRRWPSWTSRPTTWLDKKFYRGRGCAACNNTGFKGRTGLLRVHADQRPAPRPDQPGRVDRADSATWPCRRA